MSNIHIDPAQGPDAAMAIGDEELRYLCSVVLWELAVRTDQEQFVGWLRKAIEERLGNEEQLQSVRHQRDLLEFAAKVMMDIQRLPEIGNKQPHPTTGHYL